MRSEADKSKNSQSLDYNLAESYYITLPYLPFYRGKQNSYLDCLKSELRVELRGKFWVVFKNPVNTRVDIL